MFRALVAISFVLSITFFVGCGSDPESDPSPQGKPGQGNAGKQSDSTEKGGKDGDVADKSTAAPTPLADGEHIDLTYLPDGYNLAAVFHPQRILHHPAIPDEMQELVAEAMVDAVRNAGPLREIFPDVRGLEQALVMVDAQIMEMALTEGLVGTHKDHKVELNEAEEAEFRKYEEKEFKSEKGEFKDESFEFEKEAFDEKDFKSEGTEVEKDGCEFEKDDFEEKDLKERGDEFFEGSDQEFEEKGDRPGIAREIPNFVVIIRQVEPIDFELEAQRMLMQRDAQPREIDGKSCFVSDAMGLGCLLIDERSILVTPLKNLPTVIKADPNSNDPLKNELRSISRENDFIAAFVVPDQLRETASGMADGLGGQLPPDFQDLIKLPSTLEVFNLQVNLSGETLARVQVKLNDVDLAKRLVSMANNGLAMAKQGLETAQQEQPGNSSTDAAFSLGNDLLGKVTVGQEETRINLAVAAPEKMNERVAVLLQEAAKVAEQSMQANQLKMVGLAFLNHFDTNHQFPPARDPHWFDKEGKPFLSWRVHILPYLEHGNLYDQFKMDEPWDSEHNIKLLEQMPEEYITTDDPTKTTLMMVVGEGTAYEGKQGLRSFSEFTDGTSGTILVVRAGVDKAVPWTKPVDLPFNADDPVAELGEIEGDNILVLMVDGSVHRIPKDIAPEQHRALLTRNGGEDVDVPGAHDFDFPSARGVSGSATFDDGKPVSGGVIVIENDDAKVELPTKNDGSFEGPTLPEGEYRILVNPESTKGESKSKDSQEK